MGFIGYESWQKQFINGTFCPARISIPMNDVAAYQICNEEYKWVYNKLKLYEVSKIVAHPTGIMPDAYPVFVKPITNLFGMGIHSRKIDNEEEYLKSYHGGELWMPVFNGEHVSTDVAVINGSVNWVVHSKGYKNEKNHEEWDYWEILDYEILQVSSVITDWIAEHLKSYSGMLNFETIGENIIEVHLRFSSQFIDLYPRDFLDNVVSLYHKKPIWKCSNPTEKGYSVPIFYHNQITDFHLPSKRDSITSIQNTSSDEGNVPQKKKRLAIINCKNLQDGISYRNEVLSNLNYTSNI